MYGVVWRTCVHGCGVHVCVDVVYMCDVCCGCGICVCVCVMYKYLTILATTLRINNSVIKIGYWTSLMFNILN